MADYITTMPVFYGFFSPNKPVGDSAEDFVSRIKGIKASMNPPPTDAIAIAKMSTYFREEAAGWWNDIPEIDPRHQAILTDWEVFLNVFQQRYFKVGSVSRAQEDWQALRQNHDEAAFVFIQRLSRHITASNKLWLSENEQPCMDSLNPCQLPSRPNSYPTILEVISDNPEEAANFIADLRDNARQFAAGYGQKCSKLQTAYLTAKQAGQTLKDQRLRTAVIEKSKAPISVFELINFVRDKEDSIKQGASFNGNSSTQNHGGTHSGKQAHKNTHRTGAAAAGSREAPNPPRKQQKPTAKDPVGQRKKKFCRYCKKKGHDISECRKRAQVNAADQEEYFSDDEEVPPQSQDQGNE